MPRGGPKSQAGAAGVVGAWVDGRAADDVTFRAALPWQTLAVDHEERAALERRIAALLDDDDLRGAAGEAVRGYGPEIAAYLRATVRDPADADEVFSRTCEKLWQGLSRFRRASSVRTWLYTIATHAARDFQQEGGKGRTRRLHTSEYSGLAAQILSSQPAWARGSAADALSQLRQSMEPEEQALLTLRLHAGLSWKQVAAVLSPPGKPLDEAAVRKRFERLKTKLRALAAAAGVLGSRSSSGARRR